MNIKASDYLICLTVVIYITSLADQVHSRQPNNGANSQQDANQMTSFLEKPWAGPSSEQASSLFDRMRVESGQQRSKPNVRAFDDLARPASRKEERPAGTLSSNKLESKREEKIVLAETKRSVTASAINETSAEDSDDEEEVDDDDATADGEEEEDEEELEEEDDEEEGKNDEVTEIASKLNKVESSNSSAAKVVTDLFGNKIKLENNRTFLMPQRSQARFLGLGLLTMKAIILGPLIGLTIKAALIRGLFWAVGAYLLHLFFPSLLSALGLGTGLVGFAARQLQPDYGQLLFPHLANIPTNLRSALPTSINRLVTQYARVFQPVVESIRSIPEGHCRFRAVCETASYLIRNTQFMSRSLQRISATVYLNFGTEYSKAWLDGIVQSDCAVKYAQCPTSPFSMVASRMAEAVRPRPAAAY